MSSKGKRDWLQREQFGLFSIEKIYFNYDYVCVGTCVVMCILVQVPAEARSVQLSGAGLPGGCELVGVSNQAWVLWKCNMYSYLLSHLSNPR